MSDGTTEVEMPPVEAVQVLRVQPGDTLVITTTKPITEAAAATIRDQLRLAFPGVPAVVLDDGTTVRIVRPDAEP